MNKRHFVTLAIAFALLALSGVFLQTASAQVEVIPQNGANRVIDFLSTTLVTTTEVAGDAFEVTAFDESEMQIYIDQTATDTVTVSLDQAMGDKWITTVLTTTTSDLNGFVAPTLVGRWNRITVQSSGTNTTTVVVKAVAKP